MSAKVGVANEHVVRLVKYMEGETANLVEKHGVYFAASVIVSVCAQTSGLALAMMDDERLRDVAKLALMVAIEHATDRSVSQFEMHAAIDKAKA